MIRLKRVYEPPANQDGVRILVERLWLRGMTKERAAVDVWLKEIAPSPALESVLKFSFLLERATFGRVLG